MALTGKKYEPIHNKTGDDLAAIKSSFDNSKHQDLLIFEGEAALIYQIQKMQDEIDYLRTEISLNKAKAPIATGSSTTVSFGDMITVPGKGKTPASHSIVMTVTKSGVSKVTTLTLT